jgi:hypothetical protein
MSHDTQPQFRAQALALAARVAVGGAVSRRLAQTPSDAIHCAAPKTRGF